MSVTELDTGQIENLDINSRGGEIRVATWTCELIHVHPLTTMINLSFIIQVHCTIPLLFWGYCCCYEGVKQVHEWTMQVLYLHSYQ